MAEASAAARAADGKSNVQILQGIHRTVNSADEVTNKAMEQLDQQTEQIRSIDRDVEHIGHTMDQAEEIIKGMNPLGFIKQAISGRKAGECVIPECKWMWKDTKIPMLLGEFSRSDPLRWSQYQSLEDTIRDIDAHKESRRILCKIRLPGREKEEREFDDPADAVDKLRGILTLQQQALLAGVETSAPGSGPGPGPGPSSSSVPYAPPRTSAAATRSLPGQEEEALLGQIGATLDGMHEKTQQINRTLDVQNQMLPAVAEKMERERQRAEDQTKKLQKMHGGR